MAVEAMDYEVEQALEDGIEIGEHHILSRLRARVEYAERALRAAEQRAAAKPGDEFEEEVAQGLVTIVTWGKFTLNEIALEHNMRWVPKMDGGYYEKVSDEELGLIMRGDV